MTDAFFRGLSCRGGADYYGFGGLAGVGARPGSAGDGGVGDAVTSVFTGLSSLPCGRVAAAQAGPNKQMMPPKKQMTWSNAANWRKPPNTAKLPSRSIRPITCPITRNPKIMLRPSQIRLDLTV